MPAKRPKRSPGDWKCERCARINASDKDSCVQACGAARPWKRGGLHKLACQSCSCYGYFTVAMLETAGQLPDCFAQGCGGTLEPDRIELAMHLGHETSSAIRAWQEITEDKQSSQDRSLGHQEVLRRIELGTLNRMSTKAFDEIAVTQRVQARERRLSALRAPAEAIPF